MTRLVAATRSDDLPAGVWRVLDAAAGCGIEVTVTEFPDGTRTAGDAATAVGCSIDQIVKSMVFDADGELVLALTSGVNRIDPAALATVVGAATCRRADPDEVRRVTGFAIGGVAPIGHDQHLPAWIDPHLLGFDEVWAAAGTPRHMFPVTPSALVTLTGARAARFTAAA
jgi:prolyl-tRNA editing enzyme YbaK/EbsC (Cys-tRNA(Pro) deacylase)